MAQAGLIWVSIGTSLLLANTSQNDPNAKEGCRKASPLPQHLSVLPENALARQRKLVGFVALYFLCSTFERPRQKFVMLITEGSVKMKILPHICLCHFSTRGVGFLMCCFHCVAGVFAQ